MEIKVQKTVQHQDRTKRKENVLRTFLVQGPAGVLAKTRYLHGFQYYDTVLQFFHTPEGYVKNTPDENGNPSFDYIYQYKDHLGNVRLSYTQNPQEPEYLEIIEESHYYPFGLQHGNFNSHRSKIDRDEELNNEKSLLDTAPPTFAFENPGYQYKYNGKEYNEELDLNWYDYGARNYDPALGRWMNIDPLAETTMQPYSYTNNNPIRFNDPTGMIGNDVIVNGDNSDKFVEQLNSGSSLNITRDSKGKLHATGKAETKADRHLLKAINDENIDVNINATTANTDGSDLLYGGAFEGSTVNDDGTVSANQTVNPDHAEKLEKLADVDFGVISVHETLEAYYGAQNSPGADKPTTEPTKAYLNAHAKANRVDKRVRPVQNGLKRQAQNMGPGTEPGTTNYRVAVYRTDGTKSIYLYNENNVPNGN
ncbi:MAG: hypothetical protein CVU03_13200 [Bacteroidetes bacterium HGW-Bacteroidetes-2]|jgi:RHS repeat-associated protein|nr:MAG: hypothetical protein CVU03_13200 [Bacteroidetes bacterium HGW-Bacteroidetes-2]